jgi:hypothetical protein
MLTKLHNSSYFRQIVLLMIVSILNLSFQNYDKSEVTLKSGTFIPLETISLIRSDMVKVGQIVNFRVKYDVLAEGKTVIAGGSLVKGQVMRAQMAKGLGKEGLVGIQIKSATAVDGQEVFLTGGHIYEIGEDKQTLSIILGLFVCLLFLTMKGKNAEVSPGFETSSSVATTMKIKVKE